MGNCCGSDKNAREEALDKQETKASKNQVQSEAAFDGLWSAKDDKEFKAYLQKHFKGPSHPNMIEEGSVPGQGVFKTDFFLDMYSCALYWRRKLFKSEKSELAEQRRSLLQTSGYTQEYINICKKTNDKEEAIMADVTDRILDRIKKEHSFFQNSLIRKSTDVIFMGKIQQLRQEDMEGKLRLDDFNGHSEESPDRDDLKTKKEVMAIHKQLQVLSVDHMKELKKKPLDTLQSHLDIIVHVLADKLLVAVGIENEQLDHATEVLGLEEDEDYKAMEVEYTEQIQAIRLGEPV